MTRVITPYLIALAAASIAAAQSVPAELTALAAKARLNGGGVPSRRGTRTGRRGSSRSTRLTAGVARTVLHLLRDSPGKARSLDAGGAQPTRLDLTDREQDVLRCLVRGMSYKQAADDLNISLDTVRGHVRSVYRKLQVHSVAMAVSRAVREHLV